VCFVVPEKPAHQPGTDGPARATAWMPNPARVVVAEIIAPAGTSTRKPIGARGRNSFGQLRRRRRHGNRKLRCASTICPYEFSRLPVEKASAGFDGKVTAQDTAGAGRMCAKLPLVTIGRRNPRATFDDAVYCEAAPGKGLPADRRESPTSAITLRTAMRFDPRSAQSRQLPCISRGA